jgi:hypothetical protein
VVDELKTTPPTIEELTLLTEIASEAQQQNLRPEQIEARLGDTRLWQLLATLAKNDVRILNYLMVLLMIYEIFFKAQPAPAPAPPAPTPSITVNVPTPSITVTVPPIPTDEIVQQIREEIEREYGPPPGEPSPTSESTSERGD